MAARTRLAFFILQTHAGWIVRADGFVYPPCADRADALAKAIREAQAAERLGFASVVLAQSAAGERCHLLWSCAGDGGAPQAAADTLRTAVEATVPKTPAMTGSLPSALRTEKRP